MIPFLFRIKSKSKNNYPQKSSINHYKGTDNNTNIFPKKSESNQTFNISKIFNDINKRNQLFNMNSLRSAFFLKNDLNEIDLYKFRKIIMGKILQNSRNISHLN